MILPIQLAQQGFSSNVFFSVLNMSLLPWLGLFPGLLLICFMVNRIFPYYFLGSLLLHIEKQTLFLYVLYSAEVCIRSQSFLMESSESFKYRIMSSKNRDASPFPLLFVSPLLLFVVLLSYWARAENGHLCLIPDSRGNAFSFSHLVQCWLKICHV